jgi:hypothetical protein
MTVAADLALSRAAVVVIVAPAGVRQHAPTCDRRRRIIA